MKVQIDLRVAQLAEGVFALVAIIFLQSLRWPPSGSEVGSWGLWSAGALASSWLAFRLRHPSRITWVIAALLCAVVLALGGLRLIGIAEPDHGVDMIVAWISWLLAALAWTMQIVVAVFLWLARGVLAGNEPADPSTPSA
jgi:hypothetical protein